jgi:hypothetical protein
MLRSAAAVSGMAPAASVVTPSRPPLLLPVRTNSEATPSRT